MAQKRKVTVDIFQRSDRQKIMSANTPFAVKESYGMIRTNLLFTNHGEACPVYAVTSALPGDGKTVNTINMAISFAQMSKKVLLIDADMRKSMAHKYFGMSSADGLSEYLAGMTENAHIKSSYVNMLDVITCGQYPPNPAELLASGRMATLLQSMQAKYDFIFIDTPPVEVVTDATVLASVVTGYIFIVKNGSTEASLLQHSLQSMEQVNANVLGIILNNVNAKSGRYYKTYNYKYGYNKYYKKYDYSYSAKK